MNWYDAFNAVEAVFWIVVAIAIPLKASATSFRQRFAIVLGVFAFVAFGASDLLEIGRGGAIPLWLWALKVACGLGIYCARFTWRGWSSFRIHDREVLFGVGCLIAVAVLILLQRNLNPTV